jgi:hypothetical protein
VSLLVVESLVSHHQSNNGALVCSKADLSNTPKDCQSRLAHATTSISDPVAARQGPNPSARDRTAYYDTFCYSSLRNVLLYDLIFAVHTAQERKLFSNYAPQIVNKARVLEKVFIVLTNFFEKENRDILKNKETS